MSSSVITGRASGAGAARSPSSRTSPKIATARSESVCPVASSSRNMRRIRGAYGASIASIAASISSWLTLGSCGDRRRSAAASRIALGIDVWRARASSPRRHSVRMSARASAQAAYANPAGLRASTDQGRTSVRVARKSPATIRPPAEAVRGTRRRIFARTSGRRRCHEPPRCGVRGQCDHHVGASPLRIGPRTVGGQLRG
jgi:hypothetical protein